VSTIEREEALVLVTATVAAAPLAAVAAAYEPDRDPLFQVARRGWKWRHDGGCPCMPPVVAGRTCDER